MSYTDVRSVEGFKAQFFRGFPYLPVWDNATTHNTGAEVYYETTSLFYRSLNDGVTSAPTDTVNWVQYADDLENYILDADIEKAFKEADNRFNPSLVSGDDNDVVFVYYYLVAHYLVMDITMARTGVENTGDFNVASKSVGSVSISYDIPEHYKASPVLSFIAKTSYGQKYLDQIYPALIGGVCVVAGGTNP